MDTVQLSTQKLQASIWRDKDGPPDSPLGSWAWTSSAAHAMNTQLNEKDPVLWNKHNWCSKTSFYFHSNLLSHCWILGWGLGCLFSYLVKFRIKGGRGGSPRLHLAIFV